MEPEKTREENFNAERDLIRMRLWVDVYRTESASMANKAVTEFDEAFPEKLPST